jgi:hypothetical protein
LVYESGKEDHVPRSERSDLVFALFSSEGISNKNNSSYPASPPSLVRLLGRIEKGSGFYGLPFTKPRCWALPGEQPCHQSRDEYRADKQDDVVESHDRPHEESVEWGTSAARFSLVTHLYSTLGGPHNLYNERKCHHFVRFTYAVCLTHPTWLRRLPPSIRYAQIAVGK